MRMAFFRIVMFLCFFGCSTDSEPVTAIIQGHHKGFEISIVNIDSMSSQKAREMIMIGEVYDITGSLGKFPAAMTTVKVEITNNHNFTTLNIIDLIDINLDYCKPNCSFNFNL